MKRAIYTKVEQFLRDDDFIRYVMDCAPDRESYATHLQHPSFQGQLILEVEA